MAAGRPANVDVEQVVAYRLHAQRLNDASPADSLVITAQAEQLAPFRGGDRTEITIAE